MTYTPREGSIPNRAIQIIQAFGQPMPARILADRLEVDRKNINILLSAAIKHGVLKREPINNIVHYGMPTMTFNTIPPSEWGPPGNAKKVEPVKPELPKEPLVMDNDTPPQPRTRMAPPTDREVIANLDKDAANHNEVLDEPNVPEQGCKMDAGKRRFEYGYHSNGKIMISKGAAYLTLTPAECEEISEFIETMMRFHKRRAA